MQLWNFMKLLKKLIKQLANSFQIIVKANKSIFFLLIFIYSLTVTFFYGYKGVFPIDSFLIFDGGYKVLNNFYPIKDYWAITGLYLDYIQFLLFKLFGVSWFSYVLHAALVNSLLATICFFIFMKIGLKAITSFIATFCIATLAYPVAGTPFVDHHAVIFSLISVIFFIYGLNLNKNIHFLFSSFFLTVSFFSKQIPSAYLGILFTIMIFLNYFFNKEKKNIFYFFLGGTLGISIFFLILFYCDIPFKNFIIQYVSYPITIGSERSNNLNFNIGNVFFQFKLIYFSLLFLVIAVVPLLRKKHKDKKNISDIFIFIVLLFTAVIFIYTQIITKNQILIFFLIPFFLTISIWYSQKYFTNKFFIYLIFSLMLFSTLKYHIRFNENRKFMELVDADFTKAIDAKILSDNFRGLQWITPEYINNPEEELSLIIDTKNKIFNDKEKKIIITDYQILPYLTNTRSFSPNKWFDPLSVPNKENKYFEVYKNFFINKLKFNKIKNIYIVGLDKLFYIEQIIDKKECYTTQNLNKITLKLSINNCF